MNNCIYKIRYAHYRCVQTTETQRPRTGLKARFKLTPITNGAIYQVVNMNIYTGRKLVDTIRYTEAWKVSKTKIQQNGDDSFLVPNDYTDEPGEVLI